MLLFLMRNWKWICTVHGGLLMLIMLLVLLMLLDISSSSLMDFEQGQQQRNTQCARKTMKTITRIHHHRHSNISVQKQISKRAFAYIRIFDAPVKIASLSSPLFHRAPVMFASTTEWTERNELPVWISTRRQKDKVANTYSLIDMQFLVYILLILFNSS